MTEKEIQLLGFEMHSDDGNGFFNKYHYYTYTVARGLQFMSNSSDEIKEGEEWFIEVFNTDPTIRFTKFEEVQSLLNLLEKRIIQ